MNIQIVRNGGTIQLVWSHGYPVHNWSSTFSYSPMSEFNAILMEENMRSSLTKTLTAIREEAYNEGYEDHKKKRARKTWWKGIF